MTDAASGLQKGQSAMPVFPVVSRRSIPGRVLGATRMGGHAWHGVRCVSSTTINPIADAAAMMFACMGASDLLCEARHVPLP